VTDPPVLNWSHLRRLTGPHGLFEHARGRSPDHVHGYTTDDNGRALVVLARAGAETELLQPYLRYVLAGAHVDGWRNRMTADGIWADRLGSEDAMGRAVWGLGELANSRGIDETTAKALTRGLTFTSSHPRALAYLILGAAAAALAGIPEALRSVRSNLDRLPRKAVGNWRWPEPRLNYDNARIPEALIRGGTVVSDQRVVDDGIDLLEWLVEVESGETGFSFTPVGGREPGDSKPQFDQQPLEAWAMSDACQAASLVAHTSYWEERSIDAARWFQGYNDSRLQLYDPSSGAGYDGLGRHHVNLNQGAESTLAALGSVWRLRRLAGVERAA
jgi:hypothetical protein